MIQDLVRSIVAATIAKSGRTFVAPVASKPANGTASPWIRVASPSRTDRVCASASSFAVFPTLTWALTVTTCVGRASPRRPTAVVVTSLANATSRTSRSKVIARIHRASGMRPDWSAKPISAARRRRVRPTISGSVPRKRAQAACAEAATAPDPPPRDGCGGGAADVATTVTIHSISRGRASTSPVYLHMRIVCRGAATFAAE